MGITILFLLSSCRKNEKAKTAELCRELENSVMLSPAFDSLVKMSMGLPNFFRSKVLLVAGRCYSTKVEQMQQARIYLREAYRIAPRDVKNLVALELTRLYGSLILRDSCVEEAIRFISRVPSKVVFTREEEAKFYYLGACFFKSIDIDRAFRAVDQALSLYRGLSDT